MFRLFTLYLLIFCGGCVLIVHPAGEHSTDPVFQESTAREKCRENLLDIRIEENWQTIRDELRHQTLEHSLPGRLANLSAVPTPAEYQEVRKALHSAQLFLQELTAPDTTAARQYLRDRSAELLTMEFAEVAAVLLAKEQETAALSEALQLEQNAPALRQALTAAQVELAEAQMGIRPMLGLPAGHPFILQKNLAPPAPLPTDRKLEIALACRKELQKSPFTPAELAAAVRAYTSGKYPSARHKALAAVRTLLRAPRELYRRELADQQALTGMRELLTAIGIDAELDLALAELHDAQTAAETAALLPGKDPRSKAELAGKQAQCAIAQAHLEAALGGCTGNYPQADVQSEPPVQLMKLAELLEKWEK